MPQQITATGPNGEKVVLQNGQWVPLAPPQPDPRQALLEAQRQFSGTATDRPARFQAIKSGAGRFIADFLGLPHAAGELLALGAAVPQTAADIVAGVARGEPLQLGNRFAAAREQQQNSLPASALLAVPHPSDTDVLAAANAPFRMPEVFARDLAAFRAGGGKPENAPNPFTEIGTAFNQARQDAEQAAAAHPVATGIGRTAGDVATMLTLRPGPRVAALLKLPRLERNVNPETVGALDKAARAVAKGLGKSAEAGFEGAVTAALGDGDPAKTAAWTAGIQAGGSAALAAKSAVMKAPFKSLGAIFLAHSIYQAILPGAQDFFSAKDQSVDELIAAYGVGTLAGAAGAGRPVGQIARTLSSISRKSIASIISQLHEADQRGDPKYGRVISTLAENPEYFSREARARLERATRSDRKNALLNEIDVLMKNNPRFAKLVDKLEQPQ